MRIDCDEVVACRKPGRASYAKVVSVARLDEMRQSTSDEVDTRRSPGRIGFDTGPKLKANG